MASLKKGQSPLEAIKGIGPAIAKKLEADGVDLNALANATDDDLDRWDLKHGLNGKIQPQEQDWRGQAIILLLPDGEESEAMDATPKEAGIASNDEAIAAMAELIREQKTLIERLSKQLLDQATPAGGDAPVVRKNGGNRPRRLNRNLKFAEVYGRDGDHPGAAYKQKRDGEWVWFGQSGIEIGVEGDPERDHKATEPHEVNFFNWLDKKVDYDLDLLKRAIKAQHPGARVQGFNEKKCYQFLHEHYRQNY